MPIGLSSENDDSRLDLSGQAGRQQSPVAVIHNILLIY